MPGHKLGKGIPKEFLSDLASLDVTEIPGTDNLHFPEGVLKEAQELAAHAFCADRTFFLVNGSTCGIHGMIMSICDPGGKLIIGRDCHKSVIHGMMLAGVEPVYVRPGIDKTFGIPTAVSVEKLEEAIKENPDAKGVLLTSPNYYGVCIDSKKIAEIVHSRGMILAIDEAHGAHLVFSEKLPECAMEAGADICVQSAHKTLPAFTQGAYLHVKSHRIDMERVASSLNVLQTTSPSYIIMAFLDIARAIMERTGKNLLEELLFHLDGFKESMRALERVRILSDGAVKKDISLDRTRLVIHVKDMGKTGFEIEKILRNHYHIQIEMADFYNIVCIATVADRKEDFEKLGTALKEISYEFKDNRPLTDIYYRELDIPCKKIELKHMMYSKKVKVKLKDATGKISGSMLTPYPPGIPLVCPGEVLQDDFIEYIYHIVNAGGGVNGLSSDMEVSVLDGGDS